LGPNALKTLFADAAKIMVAKGKKVVIFEPKKDTFDLAELQKVAIGPSGNLRAPTVRIGKTWLIGFSEAAYTEKFGG